MALLIWSEARGEATDGKAAVGRVVLNRTKLHYASDETIEGTILAPNQFSGFWFDFVGGKYVRVCRTLADAQARAGVLLATAKAQGAVWTACDDVAAQLLAGTYASPAYAVLDDRTVLYANLAISNPVWAIPAKLVTKIGAHSFFHA
jgi:spore germination cell wall hydrolase CwlJ-like protein